MNSSKKKKRKAYMARLAAESGQDRTKSGTDIPDPGTALWVPKDVRTARCSNCNFEIETARAVETGWTAMEYTAVRYKFCPMCGRAMSVPDTSDDTGTHGHQE